jgi:glycosyltransferase involved in cell wall biosynthesis
MNILIINTLPIPSGKASVNRILSLSKGLSKIGDNVTILSLGRGKDTDRHLIEGVSYINFLGKGNRTIALLVSLYKLTLYIRSKKKNIDVVWLVSNNLLLIYHLWLTCKCNSIPLIQEKSEFPFVLSGKGFLGRAFADFYVNTTYKLFDGMIIMTQPLMSYFKNIVRRDCKLIKVPMTVDVARFNDVSSDLDYGEYAAYCGYMAGNKDGVENLLHAFVQVEKKYPEFKLLMIGSASSESEFQQIKNKAALLGLRNVVFTGQVDRDSIPSLLCNAKILCLARPSNLQSLGGFPTKLGEYLSTGKPVVVTAVGEIPSYLNSTNSFLVEPDDNEKFGRMIIDVLDDYKKAEIIAQEGKKIAMTIFNGDAQAKRLHDYFLKFCS